MILLLQPDAPGFVVDDTVELHVVCRQSGGVDDYHGDDHAVDVTHPVVE